MFHIVLACALMLVDFSLTLEMKSQTIKVEPNPNFWTLRVKTGVEPDWKNITKVNVLPKLLTQYNGLDIYIISKDDLKPSALERPITKNWSLETCYDMSEVFDETARGWFSGCVVCMGNDNKFPLDKIKRIAASYNFRVEVSRLTDDAALIALYPKDILKPVGPVLPGLLKELKKIDGIRYFPEIPRSNNAF